MVRTKGFLSMTHAINYVPKSGFTIVMTVHDEEHGQSGHPGKDRQRA